MGLKRTEDTVVSAAKVERGLEESRSSVGLASTPLSAVMGNKGTRRTSKEECSGGSLDERTTITSGTGGTSRTGRNSSYSNLEGADDGGGTPTRLEDSPPPPGEEARPRRPPPLNTDVSKEVRFLDPEATFTPSYQAYTPTPHHDLKYCSPERRQRGVIGPPSSVARPNIEDALRRVSVVIHKHIMTCERRLALSGLSSEDDVEEKLFRKSQMMVFREENFVSPQYLYEFVRVPIPGVCYSMKQVKPVYHIPSLEEIYDFMRTLFRKAALSSECSIVCLIYIERLMEVAQVPLVAITWRPIVLAGLLLASKVWQDLSSWNVEFSEIYPQFSLQSINRLERLVVNHLKWDLYISSSLYAKYYFALRSLYEKKDFRRRYNNFIQVKPPRAEQISQRSDVIKEDLRDVFSKSL